MGSYFILQAFFTMMLSGFTGGDALDFMTTDGYWKAKNISVTTAMLIELAKAPPEPGDISKLVKDLGSADFKIREAAREKLDGMGPAAIAELRKAEHVNNEQAAEAVKELLTKLKGHEKARAIERLMAIRTLGEKKEKSAIAVLEEDLKSKEPFVADYAARSLALITGKPIPAREDIKIDADAKLMPDDLAMLLQVRPWAHGKQPTIEAMVDVSVPRRTKAGLEDDGGAARKTEAYKYLIDILERTGNIRPEGLTVHVSSQWGSGKGWSAIVVRAIYDRDALTDWAKEQSDPKLEVTEGDYPEINRSDSIHVILPKPDMAIIVFGEQPGAAKNAIKEIKDALKTGKGKIADGASKEKIAALTDKGGRVWGTMDPQKESLPFLQIFLPLRKPTWLAAFSECTLTTTENDQTKTMSFEISGSATDVQQLTKAATELTEWIQQTKKNFESLKDDATAPKAAVEFFNSLKIESAAGKVKLTGTVPENIGELVALLVWGAAF